MILTKRKYESTKYDRRHDVLHVFLDSIVDSCADEEYPNILVYRDEDTNEITGFVVMNYKKTEKHSMARLFN